MRLIEYFPFHPGFMCLSPIGWELLLKNLKMTFLCPQAIGQWPFTQKFLPPLDVPYRVLSFSPWFYVFISHRMGVIVENPQNDLLCPQAMGQWPFTDSVKSIKNILKLLFELLFMRQTTWSSCRQCICEMSTWPPKIPHCVGGWYYSPI